MEPGQPRWIGRAGAGGSSEGKRWDGRRRLPRGEREGAAPAGPPLWRCWSWCWGEPEEGAMSGRRGPGASLPAPPLPGQVGAAPRRGAAGMSQLGEARSGLEQSSR